MSEPVRLRVSFHKDLPAEVSAVLDDYSRWQKESWGEDHWMVFVPLWLAEMVQDIAAEHVGAAEA